MSIQELPERHSARRLLLQRLELLRLHDVDRGLNQAAVGGNASGENQGNTLI